MLAMQYLAEGGEIPNTELSWLLYAGIVIFFVVIAVGWLTSPKEPNRVEVENEAIKLRQKSRRKSR